MLCLGHFLGFMLGTSFHKSNLGLLDRMSHGATFSSERASRYVPGFYAAVVGIQKMSESIYCSDMGVSENRGPRYSTLNSRILIIRTPK